MADDIHSRAVAYAAKHKTSYELARILVSQTARSLPVQTPAHHEPALAYMSDNPGTTYDDACKIVQNDGRLPVEDVLSKLTAVPPHHDATVAYMHANHVSYDAAVRHVRGV